MTRASTDLEIWDVPLTVIQEKENKEKNKLGVGFLPLR